MNYLGTHVVELLHESECEVRLVGLAQQCSRPNGEPISQFILETVKHCCLIRDRKVNQPVVGGASCVRQIEPADGNVQRGECAGCARSLERVEGFLHLRDFGRAQLKPLWFEMVICTVERLVSHARYTVLFKVRV